MAVLPWPSNLTRLPTTVAGPALHANTQSGGVSPFDLTEQTLALPGAHWQAELRFDRIPESAWRILTAFVASLNGQAGRFTWGPGYFQPRRGDALAASGATIRIRTAGQTGAVLDTTGWASTGTALRMGDWIGWTDSTGRPALHQVIADVAAASGSVLVPIAPAMRRATVADTPLELVAPVAVWRLTSDAIIPDFAQRNGPVASLTLPIQEAVW